jgi:hypothetical protein
MATQLQTREDHSNQARRDSRHSCITPIVVEWIVWLTVEVSGWRGDWGKLGGASDAACVGIVHPYYDFGQ